MTMLPALWLLPNWRELLVRPTLNEQRYCADAKALGLGMSLAFGDMAFELHDGYGRLHTRSDEWHFEQWSPTPTHIVATAVRARGPFRLVRHWGIPDNR